jgi:S1-C subfamily serine protease
LPQEREENARSGDTLCAAFYFSVPVNMARRVMEQQVAIGKVSRGRIGVVVEDLGAKEQATNAPKLGAVIAAVVPRSTAARAGIQKDDIWPLSTASLFAAPHSSGIRLA